MSMPEHKKINIFLLQHFLAVNDQPFPVFPEKNFLSGTCLGPAPPAHIVSYPHTHYGWQDTEKPLAGRISKYSFQSLITMITRTQSITMTDNKLLPVSF